MNPRPNLRLLDAVSERQWRRQIPVDESMRDAQRLWRWVARLCLLVMAVAIAIMVTIGVRP